MAKLDASVAVTTPEGVRVQAVLAEPSRRMWALAIDALVLCALYVVLLFIAFAVFSLTAFGIVLVIFFVLTWGYFFLFEAYAGGATLGKRALGICVVNADLTPVSPGRALWRNVLRYIDMMPGCFGVGLFCILALPRCQRLGDFIAGTLVICRRMPPLSGGAIEASPAPLPWPVDYEGQLALMAFAQYIQTTNAERAAEMAACFAPLLPQLSETERAAVLASAGAWFANGGRAS